MRPANVWTEVYVTLDPKNASRAQELANWLCGALSRVAWVGGTVIPGTAVVCVEIPPERHRDERSRAYDSAYYSGVAKAYFTLTAAPTPKPTVTPEERDALLRSDDDE